MKNYDAVVVGGGPAGSSCAWKLTAGGFRTLVLDRARFPRVKLCAGWITPAVVSALELNLEEYGRHHTVQPIQGFSVRRFTGGEIDLSYGSTVSYGIIRREFDHYLLVRSKADLQDGVPGIDIEKKGRFFFVNGQYRAPLLVGAGGHFCPVARYLGADLQKETSISAQELEVEIAEDSLEDYKVKPWQPLLIYCDDMRGYGWCFRKGRFINIGIGRMENHGLKQHLKTLLDQLVAQKTIPADDYFHASKFRGHAYKLHVLTPRSPVGDGTLLVGDAAGLAYNFSGEGIRPAVESALLAVKTIREAAENYSAPRLQGYRDCLYEQFGHPLAGWRGAAASLIPHGLIEVAGRTILASEYLTRNLLINRWFLRADNLISLAKR